MEENKEVKVIKLKTADKKLTEEKLKRITELVLKNTKSF